MAKPKKIPTSIAHPGTSVSEAPPGQLPGLNWRVLGLVFVALLMLWGLAAGLVPYAGYWPLGVIAALTVALGGFGIWAWRFITKQKDIAAILQQAAGSPEGKKAALEKLAGGNSKDALNALATAQLTAQENPESAIATLEAVDLSTSPGAIQDQIRATLALLYLGLNRVKEARTTTDAMKLSNAGDSKTRAMYAAVIAEAFARTSNAEEAKKLLETYAADDVAYAEVKPLLLRAQAFTYFATKNRGLARKALDGLIAIDPNLIGAFAQPKMAPEIQKTAREALEAAGYMTRQRVKQRMH